MKRQNLRIGLFAAGLSLAVCCLSNSWAEDKEVPKTGTLSSSVSGGHGTAEVDLPWQENVFSDERPPLTGSVSRIGAQQWIAKLFNNSEDRYSVSAEVAQYNAKGVKIKSDSYSVVLKPKEVNEREIRGELYTDRANLNLRSWKNLSQKTKQ